MTDEVAALVLRNNYLQTLALSLTQRRGLDDLGFQQRLMQTLEARDLLDRAVEFLPDDVEIAERRRRSQPLTRPELAVLLAYAKLTLYGDLLESKVPDDPYLGRELVRYFPKLLMRAFPGSARASSAAARNHRHPYRQFDHQSRRAVADRAHGGRDRRAAGRDRRGLCRGARQLRHARAQWRDRCARQQIPGKLQLELYAAVQDLLLDRLVWFLRNVDFTGGLASVIDALQERHRGGRDVARHGACRKKPRRRRRERVEAAQGSRRSGSSRAPDRQSARARGRARHRAGRRPHRRARSPMWPRPSLRRATFFRLDRIADAARRSRRRIISIGLRSTARATPSARRRGNSPRRCWQAANPATTRSTPGSRRARRGRAHPRRDARDRRYGAHAVEAFGGGEPAGRSGAK